MKPVVIVGVILIIFGIIGVVYQGIGFTKRKEVLAVGSIRATKDTHETIPIPRVVGGVAIVGGIILLVAGAKSRN